MFRDKPLIERKNRVKEMVDRMATAYQVKKSDLPQTIHCQSGTINNWSYYGRIPYEHLEQCSLATGISMNWLLHGKGPKISMAEPKLNELQGIITQLFTDADDYGMVKPCYPQAIEQLKYKLNQDILDWLEVSHKDNNSAKTYDG